MTISLDTFIEIGDQHKICEDYILQTFDPIPAIILSDGCSMSNNSEMGARILCYLAKQYLKYRGVDAEPLNYHKMGTWIIHNAELIAKQLGLNSSALDATLIVAYYMKNIDKTIIYFYGDGCLILKDESGIILKSVDYLKMNGDPSNSPYYLSYLINDKSNKNYKDLKLFKQVSTIYEDGTNTKYDAEYDEETIHLIGDHISTILITSDGLKSFLKKESNGSKILLSPEDIIKVFVTFKNTNGEFLKRRLKTQMKSFLNVGISHFDDLSVGAFLREK